VHVVQEAKLLGTAGTLYANIPVFRGYTVLLVHGDNWCQCDFRAFLEYHQSERPPHCLITMMTFDTKNPESCGIVETDMNGVVERFHEKSRTVPAGKANAAVYLLEPEVIDWLERRPYLSDFSTEVIPEFIGRIATWHNANIHRDIGTLEALRAAQKDPLPAPFFAESGSPQFEGDSLLALKNVQRQIFDS